ncbi:S41 family peptidase [Patescibacteria group bacterium]|nr:S41 family peptidase [Patescibacteria group bacterium]MCG2701528.1 S41 family peptidase [Candidatus Parcubacteria bacterium]MBU4265269.1 S41 family peptidase [Patescibacteria group bacterium]MBU4389954.1 S41 family peptidase [Patescibacteria group bacterium]MBU4397618.1 S41 family peptidase [Patescibacteria group bacterium]
MKRIRNIALLSFLMVFVSCVSFKLGQRSVEVLGEGNPMDLSLMWKVRGRLKEDYLEKENIDDKKMSYGAISGLVDSLDDPYTVFLPPSDNKANRENLAGEFGGVGISLGYKEKTLAVIAPLAKTPADKAGLRAGDLILKIIDKRKNIDKDTVGISLDEAVELIRGEIGSEVVLNIYREGEDKPFDVALKRDNIVVSSVELEIKEKDGKKIGWIKLYKFTERLYEEWDEIMKELLEVKQRGELAGIVLDLRNNPGGFLEASVMVASDFLKEGVVVKQESSDGTTDVYKVDRSKGRMLDDKMVVLINGGSASAAEILAGCLQEYKRAKLLGEKSFGKGTVQRPDEFEDGSGLHITIAKWLLPGGKNIHGEGVSPDAEIEWNYEDNDPAYEKVYESLLNDS